jgi:hypothetical protein
MRKLQRRLTFVAGWVLNDPKPMLSEKDLR